MIFDAGLYIKNVSIKCSNLNYGISSKTSGDINVKILATTINLRTITEHLSYIDRGFLCENTNLMDLRTTMGIRYIHGS